MIAKNESFICEVCGHEVVMHKSSARNHCTNCLCSKHLDLNTPGDRRAMCKGIMKPISINQTGNKGFMIIHQCEKCKKKMSNKVADDDNWDLVCELSVQV